MHPRASILLLALLTLALSGCAGALGSFIVETPNHGQHYDSDDLTSRCTMDLLGITRALRVAVGPPDASLRVWVIDPENVEASPPRGTIFVLHGIHDSGLVMLGNAHEFADAGYRAVVVDLRGHGASSGDYATFGVVEKRDLSQVVDALEREHLIAGPLGVYGMSYGAAVAVQLAGYDPRVRAVVAVSGFAEMRRGASHYMRMFMSPVGWFLPERFYQDAISRAGKDAGFDPDDASALKWIARTDAPVLLINGQWDWLVTPDNGRRLHEAAIAAARLRGQDEQAIGQRYQYYPVPCTGHVTSWMDFSGTIRRHSIAWFDRWLVPLPRGEGGEARRAG